ncbi:hypothetical protein GBK02_12710 [Dechloromonas sp. TW-R-39-2]|nr:hypothetical protein GBK02_12710 [Dechloromonas sp. TW-R-39-2]
MNMRFFAIPLLVLSLAGCLTSGKRGDTAMAVYDLGFAVDRSNPPIRKVPMAVEVRAPLWFDSLGIGYRLAYDEPARLREYARARWAGPPAQLIQLKLVRDSGLVAAGQGRARCVLRLDITEFSQVFDTATVSRAVLQGRVQWLDRSRGRLAEQTFAFDQAAGSPDSKGGVAGLTAVVEQLTAAIGVWEQERSGVLADCLR